MDKIHEITEAGGSINEAEITVYNSLPTQPLRWISFFLILSLFILAFILACYESSASKIVGEYTLTFPATFQ